MALTFRMVEAFRAVMLTAGVTRAADMLHISQPSVTRLVHDLEAALGLQLFVPDGRRIKPTDDALALYEEVEYSYAGLSRIESAGKRLRESKTQTLRVACLPALGQTLLPAVVHKLVELQNAHIQVQLVPSQAALQLVKDHKFDLALALIPNVDKGLVKIGEVQGSCEVILPPGHAWRTRRVLGAAALDGERLIAYSENTASRARLDAVFSRRAAPPRIVAEVSQSQFISDMVLRGGAVGIVDSFTAARHVRCGGHAVGFRPTIDFPVGAFTAAGRAHHMLVAALLKELLAIQAAGTGGTGGAQPHRTLRAPSRGSKEAVVTRERA